MTIAKADGSIEFNVRHDEVSLIYFKKENPFIIYKTKFIADFNKKTSRR